MFKDAVDICLIDEDGFDELLNEDPADAALVDFAKEDDKFEFPFGSNQVSSEKEQATFIFKLIKKIDEDPDIIFYPEATVYDERYFKIKQEDIDEVKKIYQKQCPAIFNQKLKSDKGFLQMLAITLRHKDDYMLHLVDDFARKRVENIDDKKYSETHWASKCPHFQITKKIANPFQDKKSKAKSNSSAHYDDVIKAAVSSFHQRCCTKLLFNNNKLINDSIEDIVAYVDAATRFIKNIIENSKKIEKAACPFQFDMCIASGMISSVS